MHTTRVSATVFSLICKRFVKYLEIITYTIIQNEYFAN